MGISQSLSPIWLGFIGSLGAGLATGLGALPTLFLKHPSQKSWMVYLVFQQASCLEPHYLA